MSKAEPLQVRFFTPTSAPFPQSVGEVLRADPARLLELRLGQVVAASHIEQRIAYRLSVNELGYYNTLRWTESPDAYLRRTLSSALFDERGVSRIVTGAGPTLDVELQSFEELAYGPARVRVSVRFVLRDERRALRERSLSVDWPFEREDNELAAGRMSEAMGLAMHQIVDNVADQVLAELTVRLAEAEHETVAKPTISPP